MYVDDEYTAIQLMKAAKKMGFSMNYQWVKRRHRMVIACDFVKLP